MDYCNFVTFNRVVSTVYSHAATVVDSLYILSTKRNAKFFFVVVVLRKYNIFSKSK